MRNSACKYKIKQPLILYNYAFNHLITYFSWDNWQVSSEDTTKKKKKKVLGMFGNVWMQSLKKETVPAKAQALQAF